MDWDIVRTGLTAGRQLVEMVLYVGMPPDHPDYQAIRSAKGRFVHWAETHGFMVVQKQGAPTEQERLRFKANVDTVMAIDAMQLATDIRPDIIVICSGDADFAHLALTLRRRGIRVEVAATKQTTAQSLRAAANMFIDLTDLMASLPALQQRAPAAADPLEDALS
jgi:uncharacterized LabA/DUF88 family protein